MYRKLFTISAISLGHFVLSLLLSVWHYLTLLGMFAGAEVTRVDRVVAWALIVLTFPVRNVVNLFSSGVDTWMREAYGIVVVAIASLIWGSAIYFGVRKCESWW